jgi:hypothetical protein
MPAITLVPKAKTGKAYMTRKSKELQQLDQNKPKILIIGGLLGLGIGVTAAYLLIQRAESEGQAPRLTTGDGVKLGVLVFGLLRQIVNL